MSENFCCAVNRLSQIVWDSNEHLEKKSYSILIMEHLRRISLLIMENSIEIESGYPFVYFARELGGKPLSDFPEVCPFLKVIEDTYTAIICKKYLEWMILIDEGHPVAIKFYDIYEPLIKLFERGEIFIGKHKGCLSIGNGLMPIPSIEYTAKIEEKDISDEALDEHDVK